MDNIPAQQAKDQLEELIQIATQQRQQFRITSEEGNVIILPEETYENILVTLELLSTPGLMEKIKETQALEDEEQMVKIEG